MMSEPGTNIEIEDVLSSIRRLVSRDAGPASPAHLPHRAPLMPTAEADCLVLTPALRIAEPEPVPPAAEQAEAPQPPAEAPAEGAAEVIATEPADRPETDQPEATVLAEEPAPEEDAETGPVDSPVADAAGPAPAADAPPPESSVEPRPMTEAETLLAQAEAALAETGSVLDTATTALGTEVAESADEAPLADLGPADLGDELTRLETTIAELEAAVAKSGVDFEPEEGHPFSAEGPAPLPDLAEEFSAEALGEAAEIARAMDQIEEAEGVEQDLADAETPPDSDPESAPDLQQDTSTAAGSGVGMDWAEATLNLARRTTSRRLEMSDAEETPQQVEGLRSSYDDLRAELAQDQHLVDSMFDADQPGQSDESVIDEAMLRDMVAQMVREELRGALGERITQNVRKLVRREIQRALTRQDYE